jgi:predicted enzyme related to lactoylglutathione lyase
MATLMQASKLTMAPAYAVLPAEDLERAREFWGDALGFEVEDYPEMRQFVIDAGEGTHVMVYERARTKAEHTTLSFMVGQFDEVMADLRSRGVEFEDYDMPGLKTVNGIVEMPDGGRGAWFTDPEGNIVNVAEKT